VADKNVVVAYSNNSPQLEAQEAREYLENKYPGLGFPNHWVANNQEALNLLERYRRLGRVWYEEYYSSHPGNPRLRSHRDNLPGGSAISIKETLKTVRQDYLKDSGFVPAGQPESNQNAVARPLPIAPVPTLANPASVRPQRTQSCLPLFPPGLRSRTLYDPQQLETLDISIYDLCDGNNYPAYYGGTVTGSVNTEYVYCGSTTIGAADNYVCGRRFCSKVVSEFEGDAKLRWEDYIQGGGKRPNYWKLAARPRLR
jgi:hypothetical protein